MTDIDELLDNLGFPLPPAPAAKAPKAPPHPIGIPPSGRPIELERVRIFPISRPLFGQFFAELLRGQIIGVTGLPDDAQFGDAIYDQQREQWLVKVYSATFPPVPASGVIPTLQLTFTLRGKEES